MELATVLIFLNDDHTATGIKYTIVKTVYCNLTTPINRSIKF